MNLRDYDHLRLHFRKEVMAAFSFFFQKGFFAEITTSNLLDTLCRTCGFNPLQVHERIQKEVGPGLLRQGILVPAEDLRSALASLTQQEWRDCTEAQLNSRTVAPDGLAAMRWADKSQFVHLQVTFG